MRLDRLLNPDEFGKDINAPDAPKKWMYWLRTSNDFLKQIEADETDKLDMLINFLFPYV